MNSCKNCDDLQDNPSGTNQDLRIEKEKSMNQNSKFTNLKVDITKIEDCCNNFSTQDVIDFKTKMKNSTDTSQIVKTLNNEGNEDETEEILEEISEIPIINISRSPINCPVSTCKQTIGVTSLLSHILRSHKQKFPVHYQPIVGNQRAILVFDANLLLLNENMCLGILLYGGENSTDKSKPGLKGICKPNSFLPRNCLEFLNHLPILMMACKISMNTLHNMNGEFLNKDDEFIIVLWLASIKTTKRIDCSLTAFSHENNSSRSTIIKVQDLKFFQKPLEFIPKHSDYLILNNGELNILTNNRQSVLQIEMYVHEFEGEIST